ncbi:hypothetical protein [Roseomonas fluvialis]|uniref:hypothetical protein n=1 Tax=Roseomonas fluvialis TaxID=1750527 RepID=UPI001FCA9F1E|nr:hypothetical protein [Roseomonas fluvialis]
MRENRENVHNSWWQPVERESDEVCDLAGEAAALLDVILIDAYEAGHDELVGVLAAMRGLLASLSMNQG